MSKEDNKQIKKADKPRRLRKCDYDKFCAVLYAQMGCISRACRAFNVSRMTVLKRRQTDPIFSQKIEDTIESIKDFGETALLKKIQEGDTSAIIFFAKTKLKDRGYSERLEVVGKDGEPIQTTSKNLNANININSMSDSDIDAEISRLLKLDK